MVQGFLNEGHTEIINVKEHNDTREEQLQLAFDDGALVLSGAPDVTPVTTHEWDLNVAV